MQPHGLHTKQRSRSGLAQVLSTSSFTTLYVCIHLFGTDRWYVFLCHVQRWDSDWRKMWEELINSFHNMLWFHSALSSVTFKLHNHLWGFPKGFSLRSSFHAEFLLALIAAFSISWGSTTHSTDFDGYEIYRYYHDDYDDGFEILETFCRPILTNYRKVKSFVVVSIHTLIHTTKHGLMVLYLLTVEFQEVHVGW